MIFRPELARLIRQGKKTQTRRRGETTTYAVGRIVPVQPGRGKRSTARILITAVEQQRLGDLTFEQARAEGFRTRDEFFAYWRGLHGVGLSHRLCDLLERIVDAPTSLPPTRIHPGLSDRALRGRLRELERRGLVYREDAGLWELTDEGVALLMDPLDGIDVDEKVWAITFRLHEVKEETPTFLAPTLSATGQLGGQGVDRYGYTSRPGNAIDYEERDVATATGVVRRKVPLDVTDPERLHSRWRAGSERQHEEAEHGGESIDDRIARAREMARARGIDVPVQLEAALEKRVRAIETYAKKRA